VLLCFKPGDSIAKSFAAAARARSFPLQIVDLCDEANVRNAYGADYALVRPDGHVAWRGDGQPDSVGHVIDVVRGFSPARSEVRSAEADHSVIAEHAITAGSAH